jgi:hypothetical protein
VSAGNVLSVIPALGGLRGLYGAALEGQEEGLLKGLQEALAKPTPLAAGTTNNVVAQNAHELRAPARPPPGCPPVRGLRRFLGSRIF